MSSIDLKDRKILYHLDLNCRQSNSQIGKKVGLKRDVVAYRIKKLQDEGLIKNFWAEINTFKLGYNVYRIYIKFQDVSLDERKQIIDYFSDYKYAWAVMSVKGPIDLDVMIWVKDSQEFNTYWNKSLDKEQSFLYGLCLTGKKEGSFAILQDALSKCSLLNPEVVSSTQKMRSSLDIIKKQFDEFDKLNKPEKNISNL